MAIVLHGRLSICGADVERKVLDKADCDYGTMDSGVRFMTTLLQQAFSEAAKLSAAEQDLLASRLLAELAAEDDFDRVLDQSSSKLVGLAREALTEHHAGLTEELDPERL